MAAILMYDSEIHLKSKQPARADSLLAFSAAHWSSPVFLVSLSILILPRFVACATPSSPCYDWNGRISIGDRPCNPDVEHSFCCGLYWTCLENGICATANTTNLIGVLHETMLMRGTCTDAAWSSSVCPKFCVGAGSEWLNISFETIKE